MKSIKTWLWMVCGILLAGNLVARGDGPREAYASLQGAERFDVVYDLRNANPMQVALYLRLIHEGFNDGNVRRVTDTPGAVIVINGTAVRLIGQSDTVYTEQEMAMIEEIDTRIKEMAKDGIQFEGCLMAARLFNVDPASFPSEVSAVENSFISMVGYQGKGYSLIAVF